MFYLQYPMTFTKERDGSYTVELSHPNGCFQGTTEGSNFDEAMENARRLLGAVLAYAIDGNEDIPSPKKCSGGTHAVTVPPLIAAKTMLYMEMKKQGIKKSTLARKLHCDLKQVTRITTPKHKSTIAQMEGAFRVLGKHIVIGIEGSVA
jgi:antitoxin HicB